MMPSLPPKHRNATAGTKALHIVEARRTKTATYDATWRRLRRQHLAAHPLCVHCLAEGRLTEATEVDHVVHIAVAPHRRLDPTNLQSLDKACHSKKTWAETH